MCPYQTVVSFTALEEFISCAEKFPMQSDYDIVKEFCRSSKDGSEILSVLDAGRRKPSEVYSCSYLYALLSSVQTKMIMQHHSNKFVQSVVLQ